MVPNGWNDGRVEDLVSGLESGVSVNGEDRPLAKGEKGVLKVSAVSYGVFDEYAVKAVTSGEELKRAKTHPKKGQIIISRSNTEELVGASAYIKSDFDSLFLPDKLWQTIPKPNSDMKWLSYVLASEHSRYTLSNLATGTSGSMKNITKGELLGLKVSIPPIPEQRKIAKILSTWDKAITTTEKLIATSKQQKKALMQQLLTGKKRLVNPEKGKAFEGEWEEVKLNQLTQITMGSSPKSEAYNEIGDGLPLLQGNADIKARKSAPRIHTSQITKECSVGDILLSVRAPVGSVAKSLHKACIGRGISSIKSKNNVSQEFIYQWLLAFEPKWERFSQGSTFEAVNSNDIKTLHITVPIFAEQQKIASVLTTADKEIEVLEAKLAHFKQEKKALMQQLLTGKRRVKVADMEVA
ncbi:restriction endonuclease subunit S [Vibrio sp. 10N.239.312.D08]|uniref:restriction endonuclease subunit S n=1 Tax=Vibrio sp. 10N.239.312.D08 TaxID=3229978 RepID=UPI00354F441A